MKHEYSISCLLFIIVRKGKIKSNKIIEANNVVNYKLVILNTKFILNN